MRMRVPMRGTGADQPVVALSLLEWERSEAVESFSFNTLPTSDRRSKLLRQSRLQFPNVWCGKPING